MIHHLPLRLGWLRHVGEGLVVHDAGKRAVLDPHLAHLHRMTAYIGWVGWVMETRARAKVRARVG